MSAVTGYRHDEILAMTAFDLGVWDTPGDQQDFIKGLQEGGVAPGRGSASRS